jgi:hypothetical protein
MMLPKYVGQPAFLKPGQRLPASSPDKTGADGVVTCQAMPLKEKRPTLIHVQHLGLDPLAKRKYWTLSWAQKISQLKLQMFLSPARIELPNLPNAARRPTKT